MILFIGDVARGDKDREGFQEIDFPAFFGPIAKWAARIDDAARIPEYVARAWRVATVGRPGTGGAGAARGHASRRGRRRSTARRRAARRGARPGRGPGPVRAAQGGHRTGRHRRRRGLEPARRPSFRQFRLPPRNSRRRRLPPPGRGRQQLRCLCRPARLWPQPQAAAAHPRGGPASSPSAPASARARPTATR